MTRLETYCRGVAESRGMHHFATLEALRAYLKTTDPKRLIDEMNLLDKHEYLRAMQEAGVPKSIWNEYVEKLKEVF